MGIGSPGVIDLEPHLKAITQEAKRLRYALPMDHGIEVQDLVAAGVAHSLEFLRFDGVPSPALVRANARQGMLAEIRRWDHGTRKYGVHAARFDELDTTSEWRLRRSTPPMPIEVMIDLLRERLKLRLAEALPFVSHCLRDDEHDVAVRELRIARAQCKNDIAAARKHLQGALAEYGLRSPRSNGRGTATTRGLGSLGG